MKGFTLLEILITIAILGFIVAGIFAILNVADMMHNMDMGLLDLQQEVRQAMDGMIREIRQSGRRPPCNITIDDNSTITFSTPDRSNIRYYLDNNSHQIMRQQPAGTGATKILTNDINNLSFCWWDGVDCCNPLLEVCSNLHILQIQISAGKTIRGRALSFPQDPTKPLTEQVRLRNENE